MVNNLSFIDDSNTPVAFSSHTFHNNDYQVTVRSKTKEKLTDFFRIKNANIALAILCACAFWQNMLVGGANNAILTTIERAFYMKSIESALFLSCYDIGNILTSPFISYLGDRTHKPKIIGLSMIGLSVGSLFMTIPEFINFDYSSVFSSLDDTNNQTRLNNKLVCLNATSFNQTKPTNIVKEPKNSLMNDMKFVFYFANTINGISSVALYTIVISYIENIFVKEVVHMRQGIYYAIGAIGVGMGMIITGNFLNLNGIKSLRNKEITSSNVNWIGAWYMIYAIGALVNFCLAILVMQFSPSLILNKTNSNEEFDSTSNTNKLYEIKSFKDHMRIFLQDAKTILSNKIFLFIVICTTCETFLIKGFSSYLTKYLEYEYRLPASTATIITGIIGFISMIGGALLGSYLIGKYKWTIKQCSKFIAFILFITSFLFLGILIHCKQEVYFNGDSDLFQESKCDCDSNRFYPVCYENKYLFQTPCFAGCKTQTSNKEYTDCSVLENLINVNRTQEVSVLRECSRPAKHCKANLVVVGFIGLAVLFLSAIIILPLLRVILESVSLENQSFALGIRSFITKLFGNIPGPIVFASIVDKACIQWTKSPLTPNKTCRLYNNKEFSKGLGMMGFGMRFLSFLFAFIAVYFVSRTDKYDLDEASSNKSDSSTYRRNTGEINQALDSFPNDEF